MTYDRGRNRARSAREMVTDESSEESRGESEWPGGRADGESIAKELCARSVRGFGTFDKIGTK
jgi:hypothetical protein